MNRKAIVLSTCFLLAMAGCSSTPDNTSNQVTYSAKTSSSGKTSKFTGKNIKDRLQNHYLAWKGVRYKVGGNDKRGIDCSGFVHLTFKKALGVKIPRSTKLLAKTGKAIPTKQLAAGDLVFFKTGFGKRHVGIYIGKGHFIHASTSKGVMKSNLNSPYWSKHYWKSTRILSI